MFSEQRWHLPAILLLPRLVFGDVLSVRVQTRLRIDQASGKVVYQVGGWVWVWGWKGAEALALQCTPALRRTGCMLLAHPGRRVRNLTRLPPAPPTPGLQVGPRGQLDLRARAAAPAVGSVPAAHPRAAAPLVNADWDPGGAGAGTCTAALPCAQA